MDSDCAQMMDAHDKKSRKATVTRFQLWKYAKKYRRPLEIILPQVSPPQHELREPKTLQIKLRQFQNVRQFPPLMGSRVPRSAFKFFQGQPTIAPDEVAGDVLKPGERTRMISEDGVVTLGDFRQGMNRAGAVRLQSPLRD